MEKNTEEPGFAPAPKAGAGHVRKRVLVVDDNEAMLNLLRSEIEDFGCAVDTSRDVEQAVESIHRHKPDLVFFDLSHDGIEVLGSLPEGMVAGIPVIVFSTNFQASGALNKTGHQFTVLKKKRPDLDTVDFYEKPTDISQIRNLLKHYLSDTKTPSSVPENEPSKKPVRITELKWLAKAFEVYVTSESINPEDLLGKMPSLEHLAYPKGKKILFEGDMGQDIYVLFKGEAIVSKAGKELARLAPGDIFGEIAFLVGVPRTATVLAGKGCEVFRCNATATEELLSKYPNLLESVRTIAKLRMEKLPQ